MHFLYKDLAKFFAGYAVNEVIVHSALAMTNMLPVQIFGINFTSTMNLIVIFMWLFVAIVLIRYAWYDKKFLG